MKVVPNSYERYLASLRNFISFSISKYGLQKNHLEKLRKIHSAEAILHKNYLQSVDLQKLCVNLLSAISSLKIDLDFKCEIIGNFYINKRLFIILLIKICKHSSKLKIILKDDFIIIIFNGQLENFKRLLRPLKVKSLKEIKNGFSLVAIPVVSSREKSVYIESKWEYLFDEFSVVNLYFTL